MVRIAATSFTTSVSASSALSSITCSPRHSSTVYGVMRTVSVGLGVITNFRVIDEPVKILDVDQNASVDTHARAVAAAFDRIAHGRQGAGMDEAIHLFRGTAEILRGVVTIEAARLKRSAFRHASTVRATRVDVRPESCGDKEMGRTATARGRTSQSMEVNIRCRSCGRTFTIPAGAADWPACPCGDTEYRVVFVEDAPARPFEPRAALSGYDAWKTREDLKRT